MQKCSQRCEIFTKRFFLFAANPIMHFLNKNGVTKGPLSVHLAGPKTYIQVISLTNFQIIQLILVNNNFLNPKQTAGGGGRSTLSPLVFALALSFLTLSPIFIFKE